MDMKLHLEKFTPNDFPEYFRLVSNEKVMEMITERIIPLEEARGDFEKLIENNKLDPSFGNFKILGTVSEEFIGLAKLEIKEGSSDQAELGYMILPEYWGKGIAGTVAKRLTEVAKTHRSLTKLFAFIDPRNIPSRKILINNGFVSKEYKDFDGLPGEVLELGLNSEHFTNG